MSIPYPMQTFGRYKLGLSLTYKLVHDRFGFDLGEQYHLDLGYRIQTTMEIDRAVFDTFGKIGPGFDRPIPRASVEPFGHRFVPAMYGCRSGYAPDAHRSASRRNAVLAALACGLALSAWAPPSRGCFAAEPEKPAPAVNYGRPFEPPTRPAFIPLPPGAVEPQGWLRDWCLTARDGYTGHMDEVHEDFTRAWALDYRMTGEDLSFWWKGAWPYEGGGYWFDGLVRLGYALHDEHLLQRARTRLDVVVDRVTDSGILFLWWLDRNDPDDVLAAGRQAGGEAQEWPVWANGLLGRALTAYHAGSRDDRVLRALESAYGGDPAWITKGFALTNLWPAFETYTWTGNAKIRAALTSLFANTRIEAPTPGKAIRLYESWYDRMPDESLPWYKQPDHGVHFNESTIPWALGYLWTGDREFLEAPCRWYRIIEKGDDGMQPSGVPVADENAGPTGSFRGTETCSVAGYIWSQITLLRVGGDGAMADRVERAFFNAAPAVVSRDFKAHVYLQSPNRIDCNLPEGGQFLYQQAHSPLCCTASLNRLLPSYVTHMWMATYDNGLAAAHYGPCKVSALVSNRVPVELDCRTDYPFGDSIEVAVRPDRAATFPLYFRIPGWCARPEISLNGSPVVAEPNARGFVRIERLWTQEENVRLRFPMEIRVGMGHDNDAEDTPYATIHHGPLLFALPIPEAGDPNTPDEMFKWSLALDVTGAPETCMEVQRGAMPDRWDWPFDSPLKIRAPFRSFDWRPETRRGLPSQPVGAGDASPFQPEKVVTQLPERPVVVGSAPGNVTLIPYGCTKFRVSMFPITEGAHEVLRRTESLPRRGD